MAASTIDNRLVQLRHMDASEIESEFREWVDGLHNEGLADMKFCVRMDEGATLEDAQRHILMIEESVARGECQEFFDGCHG